MTSYQQQQLADRWDAIVIGSGIGGLAAAALLAKEAGKRVLVLERHYTAGGYTHSFHRPGYQWDVGVHYIGQVQDPESGVRAAFDYLSGGKLEWAPMPDVYDRVVMGGRVYDFPTGGERLRGRLKEYFPGESKAIDRYFKAVRSAVRASGLYYAEKAVPRPLAWVFGGLMRAPFLGWASRTTRDVLRRFTHNEDLIGVLTAQWGNYGLPPAQSSFGIHATVASHYFDGASYPVGGASRIAKTIEPLIESAGGRVVVSAAVERVLVENGRATGVRMGDGREFHADIVVSDAGARNTFGRLLPEPQPYREELKALPGSLAHLSLYVGLKESAAELGLAGTNLWIMAGPDHDANWARFVADPAAEFPMLYISFPSAKDPQFETDHPGRATIEVVTMAPYDWFAHWEDSRWKRRSEDYESFKSSFASRMRAALERAVPQVAGKIDHCELSTPLTTRHFMNYERGEAYGLAATPGRFRARWLKPRTPIRNLYLTGQDVTSLGVTGALFGGAVAASAILGRNLVSRISKPARNGNPAAPVGSKRDLARA